MLRRRSMVRTAVLLAAVVMWTGDAMAQAAPASTQAPALRDVWRFTAAVGPWAARHALVIAPSGTSTSLAGGTAFTADLGYDVTQRVAVYGGGLAVFSHVSPGAALRDDITSASDRATVLGVTGGLLVSVPGGLLGRLEPTLRIGGGLKGYRFDLGEGTNQWQPMGDFGVGLRGGPGGPLEVHVEARYLASPIDQAKLPTRGIVPQVQRQGDLLLTVGLSLRP